MQITTRTEFDIVAQQTLGKAHLKTPAGFITPGDIGSLIDLLGRRGIELDYSACGFLPYAKHGAQPIARPLSEIARHGSVSYLHIQGTQESPVEIEVEDYTVWRTAVEAQEPRPKLIIGSGMTIMSMFALGNASVEIVGVHCAITYNGPDSGEGIVKDLRQVVAGIYNAKVQDAAVPRRVRT